MSHPYFSPHNRRGMMGKGIKLALLVFSVLIALGAKKEKGKEPTKEEVFESVQKTYRAIQALHCKYREIFEWGLTGETVIRDGELSVTSDDKIRVDSEELTIISDGKTLYRWNKVKNQVSVESATDQDDEGFLPRQVLLEFTRKFSPRSLTIASQDGSNSFRLELIPREESKTMIAQAVLWVTPSDFLVRRLEIVDLNRNRSIFLLQDLKVNPQLPSHLFEFTAPPGAEVFDLR